jgi:hypothetical protein
MPTAQPAVDLHQKITQNHWCSHCLPAAALCAENHDVFSRFHKEFISLFIW